MPDKKQKLELTWIGKDERPRLEPRILLEDPEKSHHAPVRHTDADRFDNLLIHGDNLLALKALEQDFAGQVKCIYIDPPFNTAQALEYYDDGIEHSLWLSLIQERLNILYRLLSEDGTLFIHIDDNELGYLIVLVDEIFGRNNRISVITFKQGSATGHKSINPGVVNISNFILIYAKDKNFWQPNKVYVSTDKRSDRYNQYIENINEECKRWKIISLNSAFANYMNKDEKKIKKELGINYERELTNFVINNSQNVIRLARPEYNAISSEARKMIDISLRNKNEIFIFERKNYPDMYFFKGERILFYKDKMKLIDGKNVTAEPLTTIWEDILSNNLHNEGNVVFPKSKKPEYLIKRCLEIATNPGDLVLDSFLGSGTTAAVAHKMGRRWIGIELGDHCYTHCLPRLRRVADGEDPGGITKAVGWQGGGGFRFYELGPTLIKIDAWGQPVINPEFNAEMLTQSMCKLLGFVYAPDPDCWWKQGHSTETDFLYVTTRFMTQEMLNALSLEVGEGRTLLVCCSAFRANPAALPNLTVRKIPKAVLDKCEWDHDDYSLEVKNLPQAPEAGPEPDGDPGDEPGQEKTPLPSSRGARRGRPKKPAPDQGSLL